MILRKVWEHSIWYSFLRRYIDCCTRLSFSCVNVEGLDKLPEKGGIVLAPNHCAALMDALLVLLTSKKAIAFGARSDIFKNPKAASVLRWLRILPMARERDGLSEVAKNFRTIDEIVDCLDHDIPFTIFSEGAHRAQRGMMPVKKGVFRIAKTALERLGKPVYVVPVGIDYESFTHQECQARIQIGDPIDIAAYLQEHPQESDAALYKNLCEELRSRDLSLLGHFRERRESHYVLKSLAAVVSLPVFAVCAVCSLPIWLPAELILARMDDKAWSHTVYFAVRLFLPVLWPFFSVYGILMNFYRDLWRTVQTSFYRSSARLS